MTCIPRAWDEVPRVVRDVFDAMLGMEQPPWPLVLIGKPGTGKTCAGLSMLDWYVGPDTKYYPQKWVSVIGLYMTVDDLMTELEDCRKGHNPRSATEFWDVVRRVSLVVLDELVPGRERVPEYVFRCVKQLIDARLGRPMVVISNQSLTALDTIYDGRLVSRLAAGTILTVDGEDRRCRRKGVGE